MGQVEMRSNRVKGFYFQIPTLLVQREVCYATKQGSYWFGEQVKLRDEGEHVWCRWDQIGPDNNHNLPCPLVFLYLCLWLKLQKSFSTNWLQVPGRQALVFIFYTHTTNRILITISAKWVWFIDTFEFMLFK